MKIDLLNNSGKIVDSISVDDGIFKVDLNTSVVRQFYLNLPIYVKVLIAQKQIFG